MRAATKTGGATFPPRSCCMPCVGETVGRAQSIGEIETGNSSRGVGVWCAVARGGLVGGWGGVGVGWAWGGRGAWVSVGWGVGFACMGPRSTGPFFVSLRQQRHLINPLLLFPRCVLKSVSF